MGKRARKKRSSSRDLPAPEPKPRSPRRLIILAAAGAAALAAVAAVLLIAFRGSQPPEGQTPSTPAAPTSSAGPPAPAAAPSWGILKGRWLRPDGGYVLEIKDIESTGRMQAAYLNPKPIHVAKADASIAAGTAKVFIELRDTGYPGSTYALTYDPQRDELQGTYYQAAMRQTFEVTFVRMK